MKRVVGAPKGGRVHWLLWNLPTSFKSAYILSYDYSRHNYVFYRLRGKHLYDAFIVHQSSKHYFRVTYCHCFKQVYECFGYHSTRILAEKMYELFLKNK